MTCKCGSNSIINVSGKCSDLCFTSFKDVESDGYVPSGLGIGGGDYIELDFCGNCGQIQNFVPMTDEEIVAAIDGDEGDDDDYDEDEDEEDDSF